MKKIFVVAALFGFLALAGFRLPLSDSAIRMARSDGPLFEGAHIDPVAASIFERSCRNCHSLKTEWPSYSKIFPFSHLIENDVASARGHMNLSRWPGYDDGEKSALLSEIGSVVRNHVMPPRRYLFIHPDAKLSSADVSEIYQWTRAERHRLKALEEPPAE